MKNSIEILLSINQTVSRIAASMASKNSVDAKMTSKLSRGDVIKPDDAKTSSGGGLQAGNAGSLISALSSLSPNVLAIAKLSGKTIDNFDKVMQKIIEVINNLANATTKNEKGLKNTKIVGQILTELTKGVVDAKKLLIAAPLANLGLKMTKWVIDEVNIIVKKVNEIEGLDDKSTLKKVQNIKELVNSLVKVMVSSVLLVAICVGLGTLMLLGPTKKLILGGLLFLGLTVGMIIILAGTIWLAAFIIKNTGTAQNMRMLMAFVLASMLLVVFCVGLGLLIENFGGLKTLLYGFGVLVMVLVAMVGLAFVMGVVAQIAMNAETKMNIITIIGFVLGTMLIIVASKFLGDFVAGHIGKILLGFTSVGTIMFALSILTAIIGAVAEGAKSGAIAIAIVEGTIVGAMGIVWLITKLIKSREESGLSWGDIALELLAVGGVITAFGLLAGAFGLIAEFVLAGAIALGATELIALGAIGLVHKLVKLHLAIEEAGMTWEELTETVLAVGGVVSAFGLLASAFSLLLIPMTLAIPAMVITITFANKVIGVMRNLVKLSTEIDKAGGAEKLRNLMNNDVPSILKCFNKDNLNVDIGIIDLMKLSAKYLILAGLVKGFLSVTKSLVAIAQISGAVNENGEIKPILHIDPETGQITYGEPVNLSNVAQAITGAVRIFVENSQYGFKDIYGMMNAAAVFKIIGSIVDPVNKFTKMVTSFMPNPENANELAIINYDKDGNPKPGQLVDVVQVSKAIAGAITAFVNTLYSEENITSWGQRLFSGKWTWTGFKNGAKAANKMNELFAAIVEPVSKFAHLISAYQSTDGKTLQKVTVDKEGNVIVSDQAIDVVSVAGAMGNAISTFINAVYKKDLWDIDDDVTEKALGFLNGPITKLIELSGKLSVEGADKNIDKTSASLQKFMDDFVTKKLKWGRVHVNNFSTAVSFLKKKIKDLDNVLTKDSDKRIQALTEFCEKIKEITEYLSNNKDAFSNLNDTMDKVNKWEGSNRQQEQTFTPPFAPGAAPQDNNSNNSNNGALTQDELEAVLKTLNLNFNFTSNGSSLGSGILQTSDTPFGSISPDS